MEISRKTVICLDPKTVEQLNEVARIEDRPPSEIARRAISRYLEEHPIKKPPEGGYGSLDEF